MKNPLSFLSPLFTKAAEDAKNPGLSYRGVTFAPHGDLIANVPLFYELYRTHTDVRRCVQEISQTTGKDGFEITDLEGNPIEDGQALEIRDALMAGSGFEKLKATIVRDVLVGGQAYVLGLFNSMGQRCGWQVLDPRTVGIVADKFGNVVRYVQVVKGETKVYLPDEIRTLCDEVDPDNEVLGLSKVQTLIYDVSADIEAARSNWAFFKNGGVPGTIITVDTTNEAEIKAAVEQFRTNYSGGINRHKVMIGPKVKDVKQIGSSNKDMEFLGLRGFTPEKVSAAFGVPKTILGYSDGVNYSTSDNQYRKYIENTIRPTADLLSAFFTRLIREGWEDDSIRFKFLDHHAFDLDEKVARCEKLIGIGGITVNEIRKELGYEQYADSMADTPLVKKGYEPLSDVGTSDALLPENQPGIQ